MVYMRISACDLLAATGTLVGTGCYCPVMKSFCAGAFAVVASPHLQPATTSRIVLRVLNGIIHLLRSNAQLFGDGCFGGPCFIHSTSNWGLTSTFDSHILFYHVTNRVGNTSVHLEFLVQALHLFSTRVGVI